MSRQLSVLALLLLGCCAASNTLRSRTTSEPADAHLRLWQETFRLDGTGGFSRAVHSEMTFHTDFAVRHLGDPRITHNTATEKLTDVRSETRMLDGERVAIEDNSVNETTPDALAIAPAYADVRETVVTHVGLEVGCTNEFSYQITRTAGPFEAVVPVHSVSTVGKRVIRVEAPDARKVLWQCLDCEVEPVVTEEAGGRTLTFTWTDLPAFNTGDVEEVLAPGQPRLVLGTEESWGLLGDSLLERFTAASQPTDAVRARALALAEDLATTEQRVAALHRFVVEEIRTVHWPLADLGFAPSGASEVLDRTYGHSLDKAVLLSALLASLDVPARPVLVSRDSLFAREVPALAQFSEVWLIVDTGRARFVSTTALLPGDGVAYLSGRTSLDLEAGMPFEILAPANAAVQNQARLVAELEVAADGTVTAEMHITRTGTYSPFVAAHGEGSALVAAQQVPAGWHTTCDGCYARTHHLAPELATFSVRAQAELPGEGRVLELDLPWVPGSQLLGYDIHRTRKATNTALRSAGIESVHLEIHAAESLNRRSEPATSFLSSSVGNMVSNHEMKDGVLVLDTTLSVDKRVLDPDDYLSLRDLVTELNRAAGRSILFVRER